jgi:hypothetical protein
MNASKLIASSVAALTVVGAIGLAYAQTAPNSSNTTPSTMPSTTTTPSGTMNNKNTMPSTSTTTGTMNNNVNTDNTTTERAARADRN